MENDIFDSMEDLGYTGVMLQEDKFVSAVQDGAASVDFTEFVSWITNDLGKLAGLDERVNPIKDETDSESFLIELRSFLRECACPYESLTSGSLSEVLTERQSKLVLLNYLLSELQACHLLAANKPELMTKAMEIEATVESDTSTYLKQMLIALGFPKPPDGITSFQLFSKIQPKIEGLVKQVQAAHLSKPLLKARLSEKQWQNVDYINTALKQEYGCRRDMLLKRLDVTIQSFKWSDRAKNKDDQVAAVYQPIRRNLSAQVTSDISHLLAAREDLLNVEKTSGAHSREKSQCAINKVLIGQVPDRGGRAYEHDVPLPEMPSFQQRQHQQQKPMHQRTGGWVGGNRQFHGRGEGGHWKKAKRGRYN